MTIFTTDREVGENTRDLTYRQHAPKYRRPNKTIRFQPHRPDGLIAGVDTVFRLAVGETLVLPAFAPPAPPRPATPAVYGREVVKPLMRRGRRRRRPVHSAGWWWALTALGATFAIEAGLALGALMVLS
jgi:hypothetical protein